jgi:hypothetical protein
MGTRLQSNFGQRRNRSFLRLGYQIPLKHAHYGWKNRSGVSLIEMIADNWSLQTLILLEWLKIPRISSLKRRLAKLIHSAKKTNSVQSSRPKNIEIAHELSLQLHHGRKGLRRTFICIRSMVDMIKMQSLQITMKNNLQLSSLVSR